MSWQFYNPNPESKFVGDCVVRALSFACGHGNDEVIDRLTAMMRSDRTEEERENYRKMIEQLSR